MACSCAEHFLAKFDDVVRVVNAGAVLVGQDFRLLIKPSSDNALLFLLCRLSVAGDRGNFRNRLSQEVFIVHRFELVFRRCITETVRYTIKVRRCTSTLCAPHCEKC